MPSSRKRIGLGLVALAVASSGVSVLVAEPASANPGGSGLVINEVYGGGGATSGSPTYKQDFVELYNPTGAAISLGGYGLQYRSASYSGATPVVAALSGTVQAGKTFLIQVSAGTIGGDIPTPDFTTTTALTMSASAGQVLLLPSTTGVTTVGDLAGNNAVLDAVGYGSTPTSFEGARTGTDLTNTSSIQRKLQTTAGDLDDNASDFAAPATPTPTPSGGATTPPPAGPAVPATIAQIQGTSATSPYAGQNVTTEGVVTASYPLGGFNGYYIQTGGTGGATDATPGASDAVFVYAPSLGAANFPNLGASVQVTGTVSEFAGTTEITSNAVTASTTPLAAVSPLAAAYPTTEATREAHEGELLAPTDAFTVTDTYSTNQYGEIGLATGGKPLIVPTEVADAQNATAIAAVTADNKARGVVLDDGASTNFLSAANQGTPLPWLAKDNPVRVGATATLTSPVILEYRNSQWDLQPRSQVTGEGRSTATFTNTRLANAAPRAVGGDLSLSSFNVLNYFTTTAEAVGCTSTYKDRAGNPITANDCGASGPRGAANAANLKRQQDKIVAAINILNASVVSLEEIENSVKFGQGRDSALARLVGALNAAAGSTKWAYVPSPPASALIPTADQDVIRTAFIYQPAQVAPVGGSAVLNDAAFRNARQPLAQGFKKAGAPDSSAFAVIVNHFKSKGSGADDGTGQGLANADRVAQATAVNTFASQFSAGLKGNGAVFLTGDFNAYTQEDPLQVLYGDGYKELGPLDEYSYSFGSESGSLDHVLGNPAAVTMVTGSDIWNINSGESVAFEYSRFNYNVTDFYEANQFRASDHDPVKVGISTKVGVEVTKVKVKKSGVAKLVIAAPAAGTLVVKGKKLKKTKKAVTGASTVKVTLKLKPGQRKLLVRRGKLKVTVRVVFKGADGTTSSTTEKLVLKKKRHHRK